MHAKRNGILYYSIVFWFRISIKNELKCCIRILYYFYENFSMSNCDFLYFSMLHFCLLLFELFVKIENCVGAPGTGYCKIKLPQLFSSRAWNKWMVVHYLLYVVCRVVEDNIEQIIIEPNGELQGDTKLDGYTIIPYYFMVVHRILIIAF